MLETRPTAEGSAGGYERRDMSVRLVGIFFGGLTLAVAVVLLLMWWLFDYFGARAARLDVRPSPLAETRQAFPQPRLQISPQRDLRTMRAAEDAMLGSYGWVDRKAGTVRIPIDRAMAQLAERGLPAKSQKGSRP